MTWTLVGRATITGADLKVDVGQVDLPASGALEVRVKQISPLETSLFLAGLVYVVTPTGGRELGTRKFWGHLEGEDVVLGSAGQVDAAGTGRLVIEPRTANVKLLRSPASIGPWVLDVWVRPLAVATGGGGGTTPTPEPTPTPTPDRDLLTGPIEEVGDTGIFYGSAGWATVPDNTEFADIAQGVTFGAPITGVYTFRALVEEDSNPSREGIKASRLHFADGSSTTAVSWSGSGGRGAWATWPVPNPPQTVTRIEFEPNSWGGPCYLYMARVEVNDDQLLNQPGFDFVQLASDADLAYLKAGDVVTEDGGGGDATGTISEVKVAERRILFSSSTGIWSLGARARKAR